MLTDKNFTTFEKQIEILEKRGLNFGNKESALSLLKRFGYYNIINGYKDHYICSDESGNEIYKENVTFEQIYSLYCLDRKLRTHIMEAMLEVEDTLRSAVAHTIAESFTAEQNLYLKKDNYRTGKKRKNGFKRDDILKKFNNILLDDSQPIKHYRETYKNVPPWILLKKASFGNLVNFTKLLKGPEKDKVISLMYDVPISIISNDANIKNLFMDTLFVCLDYRNIVAHGGRVYNFQPSSIFRYNPILHRSLEISRDEYSKLKSKSNLPTLIKTLELLDNQNPYFSLNVAIDYFIEEHCKIHTEDKKYLCAFLCKK